MSKTDCPIDWLLFVSDVRAIVLHSVTLLSWSWLSVVEKISDDSHSQIKHSYARILTLV